MFDVKRIGKFDNAAVGNRIRMMRQANKMSCPKLAEMIGISHQSLNHYENGNRNISAKSLCDIAVIFDVSTDYILGSMSTDSKQSVYMMSEELGLSAYAIECLCALKKSKNDINIIEDLIVSLARNHNFDEV